MNESPLTHNTDPADCKVTEAQRTIEPSALDSVHIFIFTLVLLRDITSMYLFLMTLLYFLKMSKNVYIS